jgi:hypothetical protein
LILSLISPFIFQLSTERNYLRELAEILCHYVQPFEALELSGSSQIPATLRGQADILFGNIRELVCLGINLGTNFLKNYCEKNFLLPRLIYKSHMLLNL